MNHQDHVALIAAGIEANAGGSWADLGAGSGAFTLALRDLAGPDVEIVALDRDASALRALQRAMDHSFPGTRLRTVVADFTELGRAKVSAAASGSREAEQWDGIVIANALHYVRDHIGTLRDLRTRVRPGGRLIIVEYDTDVGNRWVPYPLSRQTFQREVVAAGWQTPRIIGDRPSRFLGRIYAGVARA